MSFPAEGFDRCNCPGGKLRNEKSAPSVLPGHTKMRTCHLVKVVPATRSVRTEHCTVCRALTAHQLLTTGQLADVLQAWSGVGLIKLPVPAVSVHLTPTKTPRYQLVLPAQSFHSQEVLLIAASVFRELTEVLT